MCNRSVKGSGSHAFEESTRRLFHARVDVRSSKMSSSELYANGCKKCVALHEDFESVIARSEDEGINFIMAKWECASVDWLDGEVEETIACLAEKSHEKIHEDNSLTAIKMGVEKNDSLGESTCNVHDLNNRGSGIIQEVDLRVNHSQEKLVRGVTHSCMEHADVDRVGPISDNVVGWKLNYLGNYFLMLLPMEGREVAAKFMHSVALNLCRNSITTAKRRSLRELSQITSSMLVKAGTQTTTASAGTIHMIKLAPQESCDSVLMNEVNFVGPFVLVLNRISNSIQMK
ncbi:hypothetical protein VNO78_15552 [Psophocarpus tetragonolobus]|uniref:Uncharacterized protein n=1 Tax=Psophocarpus tetragonolobus TaxID=3891 RepID=A0AAN9SET2_PSOTE